MSVSADSLRLAVVEEATLGVTPATPGYDLFRTTGEGLTYEVNTTQSEEMGGLNRGVKDSILVGAAVNGEISFEMSKFKAFEDMIAACLGDDWGDDPLSVPGSTADNVYNASNRRTFTIEKRFTLDDSPTYAYHRFTGCLVDTMALSITPNETISGSFGFIGNEMVTDTAEVVGSTYAAAASAPVMTAPLVTGIELLSPEGIDDTTGVVLGSPVDWTTNGCFTGMDIALSNNGRGLQCIGALGVAETVLGRFEGNMPGSLYYAGDEPLDALIDQTPYALRVTCTDDDGESIQFLFPYVKLSTGSVLASGTNTDVMTELTLEALEYAGDDYAVSLIITRSAAATAAASAQQQPAMAKASKSAELGASTE